MPRGPADAGRDLKPERGQDHGQGVSANSRVKMKNKVGQKTPDNMDGQDADVPSSHQDNYALDNEDMSNSEKSKNSHFGAQIVNLKLQRM